MALTARQDIFIRRLLEGDSQRKAYRAAFPSSQKWKDSTVDSKASALFHSDKVQERYQFLKKELDNKSIMHRTERMITLSKIAPRSINRFVRFLRSACFCSDMSRFFLLVS